ncbi:hypothetical protein AGR6A_pAt60174 [Agrobacterium sp. NCPPB 925]|nr:hypothetical protein AGR6A_pAt60174 [Agrobacterium sp. NCPPB 925]
MLDNRSWPLSHPHLGIIAEAGKAYGNAPNFAACDTVTLLSVAALLESYRTARRLNSADALLRGSRHIVLTARLHELTSTRGGRRFATRRDSRGSATMENIHAGKQSGTNPHQHGWGRSIEFIPNEVLHGPEIPSHPQRQQKPRRPW